MTGGQTERLRHAEHVMGTVVSFDVPSWARGPLGQAVRWLHWVDRTFSPYLADSDVSRLGAGEVSLAQCAPELTEVLEACAAVSALSDGYFTTTPGGRFDPSGYVKGWAIERAAAMVTAAGSAEHSVNGGGDVQCVGDHGSGQPWRIGIADPLRPGTLALVVAGRDFAVATSGVAERGPHILNPHTGQPATDLASVTVVGPGTDPDRCLRHGRLRDGLRRPRLGREPGRLRGVRHHQPRRGLADQRLPRLPDLSYSIIGWPAS
jgi:FAD:protein FMN transferase